MDRIYDSLGLETCCISSGSPLPCEKTSIKIFMAGACPQLTNSLILRSLLTSRPTTSNLLLVVAVVVQADILWLTIKNSHTHARLGPFVLTGGC